MNRSRMAIGFALVCMLPAAVASAQQRRGVQPTGFDYGSYYAQPDAAPSPSDRPVPEPAAAAEGSCDCQDTCCNTCGESCCRCGRPDLECPQADPWRLFKCFNENECGYSITGFAQAGFVLTDDNNPSGWAGPVGFADREEFMLNQFYTIFERALKTDDCGWNWGYRVDLPYGTDARYTDARGLELNDDLTAKWNNDSPTYGLAMPQLYLALGYDDWTFKVGHYYTIVGYEVVPSQDNFFYTHAYTMIYGEPFTHTGVLATYKYSDDVTLSAGVDRGWDNWEDDAEDRLNFLGGITWKNDEGLAIAFAGTLGREPDTVGTFGDRAMGSLVVSKDFNTRWKYVFQSDLGVQDGEGAVANSEWYGINQYLFYKINCCWSAGLRAEWFRDDDGVRVLATGSQRPGPTNPASAGGFAGNFYEVTLGANWSPNDNLIIRPEVRFDWFEGDGLNNGQLPYGDGASKDQVLFAMDLIYKF